ncbi:ATP-dependent nuclease [Sphingobacterium deserti]|uniref:ATP-dependent endonuclease of the OLD family n=1 Tax=Sphingobacterium deserti TaxID=1229276 RepID=A0A0B8T0D5_9SPHI|nr:AAA family ATPase [Sphingobacterium deserti]KGE13706.1 ATP-dependent endonuclease of the OLD family [Sphingobacterium deserti]
MAQHKNPYISRVQIKNFRNFLDVDVALDHKQVIIGENNVGKTNFLRAIQLILDKDYSDSDRQLTTEDFHDSIDKPMENGEEIEINLEIKGYEHNSKLKAQFVDAVISDAPPTLRLTYKFIPNKDEFEKIINYKYIIFKGNNEEYKFRNEDRSYINIYVIRALRDVERELKSNRNSPLYKLVKQYEISSDHLEEISDALKEAAEGILELDEIVHIKDTLSNRFASLSGLQTDHQITLRTFDIDTERLLYTLQVYMGLKERPVSELSLGLANILYISLMLILLKDKTILPIIKPEQFDSLVAEDEKGILSQLYEASEKGNYILKKEIEDEDIEALYNFMDEHNYRHQAFTILAVEEPEAHLHPTLQRLIYREVLHNSNTSVIFTSHSTYITSVTPLNYVVHIRKVDNSSKVFSTVNLSLQDKEKRDIERYIDAKRGEIYFGKGIILAEGITEEYFIPAAADLIEKPLDNYGIVVCNVDSTNFKPYIQLLNTLNIPWVLFTDGDYYEIEEYFDKEGKPKTKRIYHIIDETTGRAWGYKGNENILNILSTLGIIAEDEKLDEEEIRDNGCFIGQYTLEVDMMNNADEDGIEILKNIYNELKSGGDEMQENFEDALDTEYYWSALRKIEGNISKGRFAQRLADELILQLVPDYISEGIEAIVQKVKDSYE